MTTVENGKVVEVNYTLTNSKSEVIDTTSGRAPLAFIHGKQGIIPKLEEEMLGKKVGDSFNVEVAPEDAYGNVNPDLIQAVPKENFGEDANDLELGTQFQVQGEAQQPPLIATVVEIKDNEVVLDANHPLAGETLYFAVEVSSVRDATEEELAKGHLRKESSCCEKGTCS